MERHPLPPHAPEALNRLTIRLRRSLVGTAAVAGLATGMAFLLAPSRAAASVLMAAQFVLGLGLAGLLLVAFGHVTGARWITVIRRAPEALAAIVPFGAVCVVVAAVAGLAWLYEWAHEDVVSATPLLAEKSAWLNAPAFLLRTGLFVLLWMGFSRAILQTSRRQDESPDPRLGRRAVRLSAGFLVVFALTFTLASVDWIMSLTPHWYSTIFAAYNFSSLMLAGLAATVLLVAVLRRLGVPVSADHRHDLAKLLFGFSIFWAYIWYCQYMLIWYANIPEETAYFVHRTTGTWGPLLVAGLMINWLIPFFVLLPRRAKRSEGTLIGVAVLLLFGRWLDLYLLVEPAVMRDGPDFGLPELAPMVCLTALAALFVLGALGRHRLQPCGDPTLRGSAL